MKAITAAAIVAITAILGLIPANAIDAPQEPPSRPQGAETILTQQPTPPVAIDPYKGLETVQGRSCPGWGRLAGQVGWPKSELRMVSAVAYFESRCRRDALGDQGRSISAMQIHSTSWCRPTRYYPNGYLQTVGIINSCDDLWDPATNLRAALEIWRVGGWRQWTTWQKASNTLGG
jgi:hypothetical protein